MTEDLDMNKKINKYQFAFQKQKCLDTTIS